MKKGILFFVFFAITLVFANAQYIEVPPEQTAQTVQTTEDEYNYVTREYKSYLPIKMGYKLEEIKTVSYALNSVDRVFNFKKLIRLETNETAAILVEYVRVSKGKTYTIYFCIPHESSSDRVWKLVQDTIEEFGTLEVRNAYIWALTKYISRAL